MTQLSIIIPAREEEWLDRTIQDILENSTADTEVIAILDGYLPNPPLTQNDPRVTLIYNPKSKGQRAAANQAAKIAKGKYLMKVDAHCAFDKGFDTKMLEAFQETGDNVTMIPLMKNLHVFDWVCPQDHTKYQGKDNTCNECGQPMHKNVLWQPKSGGRFTFTFDTTMHFQYDGKQAKKPESLAQGNLRETLSIQGSCFMLTRDKWFELDICSEDFHSWGQQGVEVACKTWLSGGRVISNLNTWYAHMFRTNNFGGFPYDNPQSKVDANRELSRELFQRNKWPLAIHTFEWLLERFRPVPGWHDEPKKGIIYYTDSLIDEKIALPVRNQLSEISGRLNIPIVSSSLKKLEFGEKNTYFPSLSRSPETMFKEILAALEKSSADIIFFCEHDVLYHPSHFEFVPKDKIFYFNNNVWKIDINTKRGVKVDVCEQLSGMCVYKETALVFVREKLQAIQSEGFDRHYEPQGILRGGWMSREPNVDLRHDTNLTPSRWSKEEFKNQDNTKGWIEGECPVWAKDLF